MTAEVNSTSQSADTTFKPDKGTAHVESGALVITTDNQVANGPNPDVASSHCYGCQR
ncbi:hypothetical protein ABC733_03550 [Mangrovibacter sp. SLW1]